LQHVTRLIAGLVLGLILVTATPAVNAQDNPPAVVFESFMDSYFGEDDGLVSLYTLDLVFAPEGQIDAVVGIVNANGDVMAQFGVYPDYKLREGVFGRVQVVGPADLQIPEPGIYTIVFVANGQAISRFAFLVEQTGDSSDPYNPQSTYAFDGYWRTLAHITLDNVDDTPIPVFSVWFMPIDMPTPDAFQEFFNADLYRDGALIARAKKNTSSYGKSHFGRQEVMLFQPHEEKEEPNALPLTVVDISMDGAYELKITRASDGAPLRSFSFTVSNGEISPLPRTQLGSEPMTDFIAPRVLRKGSTAYEFEEAIWIAGE